VTLIIWDIAGQPMFKTLRKRYYEGCSAIVLVYAVDNRESFDNALKWLVEAYEFMGKLPSVLILGNKTDLRQTASNKSMVSTLEGEELALQVADRMGTTVLFRETTAVTGEGIEEAFTDVTRLVLGRCRPSDLPGRRSDPVERTDNSFRVR
jgi:GTPase SAR1 family protein